MSKFRIKEAQERALEKTKTDACTAIRAERLKGRIERYWAERGYSVRVEVGRQAFHHRLRSASYVVRSNMTNGWPS